METTQKTPVAFVQEKTLILLDYFHEICEKENLDYSLAYGTMLGAVRHKGFIPWDDDVDIFMLRGEYDRFTEVVKKYPRNDLYFREHRHWIKKIVFTTPPDYYGKKLFGDEIHLDIFILDELPESEKERNQLYYKIRKCQGMLSTERIFGRGRPFKDKFLMLATRFMGRFCRKKTLCKRYDGLSKQCAGSGSAEYFNSNHGFFGIKRIFKKEWLETYSPCTFDGRECKIFSRYDDILTAHYGDYMTPPPESERIMPHLRVKD